MRNAMIYVTKHKFDLTCSLQTLKGRLRADQHETSAVKPTESETEGPSRRPFGLNFDPRDRYETKTKIDYTFMS